MPIEHIGGFHMTREELIESDKKCAAKAQERKQLTFTLVEQDMTSPAVICEWIKQNIYHEVISREKLHRALDIAYEMVHSDVIRKMAD